MHKQQTAINVNEMHNNNKIICARTHTNISNAHRFDFIGET